MGGLITPMRCKCGVASKGVEADAGGSAELWKQAVIVEAEVALALAHLRLCFSCSGEQFGDGGGIGEKWKQGAEQGSERRVEDRRVSLEEGDAIHAVVIISGDPFEKGACVGRDAFAGDGVGSAMNLGAVGAG